MKRIKSVLQLIIIISMMLFTLYQTNAEEISEASMRIRLLETTDLHAHIIGFDYKNKQVRQDFGLARTASLIKKAREEEPNNLLFDVGDALVGNALDEYVIKSNYMNSHYVHPVYKAMNLLGYDAATVGNHEFNHGLDFLHKSIRGANFPFVNANIYIDDHNHYDGDDLNYFNPFIIVDRKFIDNKGRTQNIKIGVIGLITPITEEWDKQYFQGKLKIKNIKETAEHFVPIMKNMGADVIIALAHVGLEADKGMKEKEGNQAYALSKVERIDAVLYGHSHLIFPEINVQGSDKSDVQSGMINGIPYVQAGYWGNHLGIIDLHLERENGKWTVKASQSVVKPIYYVNNNRKLPLVNEDQTIIDAVKNVHKEIQNLMNNN